MITSASPMAINRSRVQTRTSWRNTCAECDDAFAGRPPAESELFNGDAGAEAVPLARGGTFVSSGLSILRCLSVYNMAREKRATREFQKSMRVSIFFVRTYDLPLPRIRAMR